MRKSKFLSVLTATTLALTLAVPTVMPLELTTGVVKAVEVTKLKGVVVTMPFIATMKQLEH